jgi:hypothetical protein
MGKETDAVPVSLYTLAKIAEDIELLWLTDDYHNFMF